MPGIAAQGVSGSYYVRDRLNTHRLYKIFISPRSLEPNAQNQEVVLNWLLVGSLGLTLAAFVITLVNFFVLHATYLWGRLLIILGLFVFFGLLLVISRRYQQRILPSVILVAIFFATALSIVYQWDVSNPYGILLFSVAIVMAGILLNARSSLYMALLTSLALGFYRYGKAQHYWSPNLSWEHKTSGPADVFSFAAVYAILALITWLFNRQMELALTRAKRSEKALKRQRDLLEVKVEQRTRELQAVQLKQIQEVYRFAELGRLSTALFHDLANHLMSVSIDIEGLKEHGHSALPSRIQENIHHIDEVVKRVRRQLGGQSETERFNIMDEIQEVIKMLEYQANQARLTIAVQATPPSQEITYRGDLTRFRQIIINLLSNALEAYDTTDRHSSPAKPVLVTIAKLPDSLVITITDYGKTIKPSVQAKVFEPFYSTKDKGMGIGLFIVKKVTEQDFGGTIWLNSSKRTGTTFVVTLPLRRHGR